MVDAESGCFLAVISHARPQAVKKMQGLLGSRVTWFVGEGEAAAYRAHGAAKVVESGLLCPSRNAALDAAFKARRPCVQFSDDLGNLRKAEVRGGKKVAVPVENPVRWALRWMLDASLAGVAPTDNPFYFHPLRPVHTRAFVVGDLILVRPCDLRFDETLRLKEDYDYTLQHLGRFGRVARCDMVLASFAHRTNPGGACEYRTSEREKQAIATLVRKWGRLIRPNPRRPDEIMLALPRS